MPRNTYDDRIFAAHPEKSVKHVFGALAVLCVMAATGLFSAPAFAATAASTKTVSFSAKYSGKASLLINGSSVTIPSVTGKGTGTASIVGASTIKGSGSGSASGECDPFGGTGKITGAGSVLNLVVSKSTSKGCSSGESGPVTVSFSGVAVATGVSGRAKGAAGRLEYKGSLSLTNTTGTQSGSFSVTFSGKLTVKS
jgi:hypothetical protein